jgi:hypothetical protein
LRAKSVLQVGPSYLRQRAAAQGAAGDLRAVVDGLLREMREDAPEGLSV